MEDDIRLMELYSSVIEAEREVVKRAKFFTHAPEYSKDIYQDELTEAVFKLEEIEREIEKLEA